MMILTNLFFWKSNMEQFIASRLTMLACLSKIEWPQQRGESFLFNVNFSPTLPVVVVDMLYCLYSFLFENTLYQIVFRETITLVQISLDFSLYRVSWNYNTCSNPAML